jgi:Uma2 family endonuclease
MLQAKIPQITRHDYQEMPEGPPYFQVIEGELVMAPSPNLFHQEIAGCIYALLLRFLERKPLGSVFVAPLDVFLSDVNVYQPDVIFVSNARRSILTERGVEGAPDLVVEVLSPGTARYDRGPKRKIYARTGVKELWMVEPETKSIQVYELTKNAETPAATHGPDSIFKSSLLPGLKIRAQAVFKSSLQK